MKARNTLLSIAVATIVTSSPILLSSSAWATESKTTEQAVIEASADADEASFIKTVEEAFKAIQEIRSARVAIFNGTPEEAVKFTAEAKKDLELSKNVMHEHSMMTQKAANADDAYIPFDASMALAEGFVPSEEKQTVLKKANEHLTNGEKSQAVNALKLANIEVSVSAAMLPAVASLKHVEDAIKLLDEKKYYEANLALKAVEDSVIIESYDVKAIPVQGKKG